MKKYRQAVSALVLRPSAVCTKDGCGQVSSILLVHKPRNRDAWQLPQGGIEEGENAEQAALRELMEETGLRFTSVTHVSPCDYCYDFPKEFMQRNAPCNDGQRLCFVVIETDQSAKVTVDKHEIDAFVWVLPEQLPQYIERKAYLDVIKEVLNEYERRKK